MSSILSVSRSCLYIKVDIRMTKNLTASHDGINETGYRNKCPLSSNLALSKKDHRPLL